MLNHQPPVVKAAIDIACQYDRDLPARPPKFFRHEVDGQVGRLPAPGHGLVQLCLLGAPQYALPTAYYGPAFNYRARTGMHANHLVLGPDTSHNTGIAAPECFVKHRFDIVRVTENLHARNYRASPPASIGEDCETKERGSLSGSRRVKVPA